MLYRNGLNSGAIGFIKHAQSTPISPVKIIPLDLYPAENKIAAEDVKYVWIDTEGFEEQTLLGAKNLLTKNPAPIYMECNSKSKRKNLSASGFADDRKTRQRFGASRRHFPHQRQQINGGFFYGN